MSTTEATSNDDDRYFEILDRAAAAQACPSKHHCVRRHRIMGEWSGAYYFDEDTCGVCDLYEKRKQAAKEGQVLPFYLVVSGIDRYCYSSAEGGCWADWHRIIDVRKAYTFRQGIKILRALRNDYPPPRYNRFSVLGGEDIEITLCYDENDPRWPQETTQRQRYE